MHNIMEIVQLNANAKLSEHFTLGEFTKSGSHPEVYNIPSHEAIANLKRLCVWLEALREASPGPTASPSPSKGRGAMAHGTLSMVVSSRVSSQRRDCIFTMAERR